MSIKMISGELNIDKSNLNKGCVTLKFAPEGTAGLTVEGPANLNYLKEIDEPAIFQTKPIAIVVPSAFHKPGLFNFFTDLFTGKAKFAKEDAEKLSKIADLLEGREYALQVHTEPDQAKICWASIDDKGISEIQFMFLGEGGEKGFTLSQPHLTTPLEIITPAFTLA